MAKSKFINLQYSFIFTPGNNSWENLYEFEKDLSDFFSANGLDTEILTPINGTGGVGVMMITKMDDDSNMYLKNKKGPQIPSPLTSGKAMKSSKMVTGLTKQLSYKTNSGAKA